MNKTRQITYFQEEGRTNQESTIDKVIERWERTPHLPIVCFAWGSHSVLTLREQIGEQCKLIAVTQSPNKPVQESDEVHSQKPPLHANLEEQQRLQDANVPLVYGIQAFDDILLPGADSQKHRAIRESLRMVSGALPLCIDAVLMACSAGHVEAGNELIAFAADTAIVAVAAIHPYLFHPGEGLEIREILCKPRILTRTRPRDKWQSVKREEKE